MTHDADRRWIEALQARLDDTLPAAERRALEAELAARPELAREAEALERLSRLARSSRVTAPDDFADRVMAALDGPAAEEPARRYIPPPEPGFLTRLFGAGGLRPALAGALALAAVAVAVTFLVVSFQSRLPSRPDSTGPGDAPQIAAQSPEGGAGASEVVVHRFVLEAPGARKVCLVGDFNDWKLCEVPMVRDAASGQWVAELTLPRGRHQYMFVVDDRQWETDPHADARVDDGFGNQNAVVFL